jgi:hypothetical protein
MGGFIDKPRVVAADPQVAVGQQALREISGRFLLLLLNAQKFPWLCYNGGTWRPWQSAKRNL